MTEANPKQWHLEKGVSIAHITATLGFVVMLAGAWSTQSTRLAVLESQLGAYNNRIIGLMEQQSAVNARQDLELAHTNSIIRENQHEIGEKLDNLMIRVSERD